MLYLQKNQLWWSSHDDTKKVTIKYRLAGAIIQNSISSVLPFISIHCCSAFRIGLSFRASVKALISAVVLEVFMLTF